MQERYISLGDGLFFEATEQGTVEVFKKDPARLSGRTVARSVSSVDELQKGVDAMRVALANVERGVQSLSPVAVEPEPTHVAPAAADEPEVVADDKPVTDEPKPAQKKKNKWAKG